MNFKSAVRVVYGRLVTVPVAGPFVRLPLRLARWSLGRPDTAALQRVEVLMAGLDALRGDVDALQRANDDLRARQEHDRLVIAMLCAGLQDVTSAQLAGDDAAQLRVGADRLQA